VSHKQSKRALKGAAMVEAVIALPLLGLLLVTMPALHERHATRQKTLAAARECAFAHALNGCSDVPAACVEPPGSTRAPVPAAEADPAAIARAIAGDEFGVFDELPLIGEALGALLGETTEARVSVQLRPRGREKEAARIESAMVLVCNERPRDVLAIARATFCDRIPLIDCGDSR
jgi:hypothetical protein